MICLIFEYKTFSILMGIEKHLQITINMYQQKTWIERLKARTI